VILNNTATGRSFAPPSAVTNVMFNFGAIVAVLRCVNVLCKNVYGILLCYEYRNVLVQFHYCEKRFFRA
jgi:hypothetical protein